MMNNVILDMALESYLSNLEKFVDTNLSTMSPDVSKILGDSATIVAVLISELELAKAKINSLEDDVDILEGKIAIITTELKDVNAAASTDIPSQWYSVSDTLRNPGGRPVELEDDTRVEYVLYKDAQAPPSRWSISKKSPIKAGHLDWLQCFPPTPYQIAYYRVVY